MAQRERKIQFTLDEHLARRLAARAADVGKNPVAIIKQEVTAWLGSWGLRITEHVVRPGETLAILAQRYYRDPSKHTVIAAFNGLSELARLRVGQTLLLPEIIPDDPLPKGSSPFIFGMHDRGGEHYMTWAGRKGWVLVTEELGAGRTDWSSRNYDDLAEQGFGVMVRLNHGYGPAGTLPRSERYADFAVRCGNFVERSSGCRIWIIANEPNLAVERPGGPANGEVITPAKYAQAFAQCRQEIKRRPGHNDDQVVTAAVGPWNIETNYPANPSGDWVIYLRDMLTALKGGLDGIALHTYGRDANPAAIVSEERMDAPFSHRRKMFRSYVDLMEAIPISLRHLPVYMTEVDQNDEWVNVNRGWIQEAYAEINRWNGDPTRQKIRCMLLYRWEKHFNDKWWIQGKSDVINDWRAALQNDYRWYG